jgi:hypothetical protein
MEWKFNFLHHAFQLQNRIKLIFIYSANFVNKTYPAETAKQGTNITQKGPYVWTATFTVFVITTLYSHRVSTETKLLIHTKMLHPWWCWNWTLSSKYSLGKSTYPAETSNKWTQIAQEGPYIRTTTFTIFIATLYEHSVSSRRNS